MEQVWILPWLGSRWAEIWVVAGPTEAQYHVAVKTLKSLGIRAFAAFSYNRQTGATIPVGVVEVK